MRSSRQIPIKGAHDQRVARIYRCQSAAVATRSAAVLRGGSVRDGARGTTLTISWPRAPGPAALVVGNGASVSQDGCSEPIGSRAISPDRRRTVANGSAAEVGLPAAGGQLRAQRKDAEAAAGRHAEVVRGVRCCRGLFLQPASLGKLHQAEPFEQRRAFLEH
jgi:hypothetical protein